MSILRRSTFNRIVPVKATGIVRVERIACPRCATVNCTRHSAGMLSARDVPAHLRSGAAG